LGLRPAVDSEQQSYSWTQPWQYISSVLGNVRLTLHAPLSHDSQDGFLSKNERAVVLSVAQFSMPDGRLIPGAGPRCVEKLEELFFDAGPWVQRSLRAFLHSLDLAPVPFHGRPLRRLSPEKRDRFLEKWAQKSFLNHTALRVLTMPLKALHFDDPTIFETLGCIYKPEPSSEERPRYMDKVFSLPESDDETIEVDAVVVGTGAGGAPVAHGLAKAGHAVLMLEEGAYFTR